MFRPRLGPSSVVDQKVHGMVTYIRKQGGGGRRVRGEGLGEKTGSTCRCPTGMLRRGTSPRPSAAMGTPQGWLRRTGKPRWHTACIWTSVAQSHASRMSGVYLSLSGGSSHCWRSRLVFVHIAPYVYIGEPEGPHSTTTTGGCGLQDPLWHVSQGVCWPDLSDIGSLTERAQESTYKWEPGPACNCRVCGSWVACHRLGRGQGGGHPPTIPPEMCTWVVAHQVRDHHNEQRRWQLTTGL